MDRQHNRQLFAFPCRGSDLADPFRRAASETGERQFPFDESPHGGPANVVSRMIVQARPEQMP